MKRMQSCREQDELKLSGLAGWKNFGESWRADEARVGRKFCGARQFGRGALFCNEKCNLCTFQQCTETLTTKGLGAIRRFYGEYYGERETM